MAFWKMVGFVVWPTTASSFSNRFNSPDSSMWRESESIQIDCPRALSLCRFDSAMCHLPFHRGDFFQPLDVTLAAAEARTEERAHEVDGEARPDHFGAETEDVHVVVLDTLVRRVDVVANRGADARDLAGGDG